MNNDTVLSLLFDQSGSLRELARKSGFDEFSFYNGATLIGLRLGGQDLRGLNFENADLRGADLEGVSFDPGAFNGAKLSSYADSLKDDFEFYVEDIAILRFSRIYFYARFRPETLENALLSTAMTYQDFSSAANINLQTLRRARRGHVVSCETAFQIAISLSRVWRESSAKQDNQVRLFGDHDEDKSSNVRQRQPFIEVLDLRGEGKFVKISRADFISSLQEQLVSAKEIGSLAELEELVVRGYVKPANSYRTSKDIFF